MKSTKTFFVLSLSFMLPVHSLVLDFIKLLGRAHDSHPIEVENSRIELNYATAADTNPISTKMIKRQPPATWRVIDNCPEDAPGAPANYTIFHKSICNGLKLYSIECDNPVSEQIDARNYVGSCRSYEFCHDIGSTATDRYYTDWNKAVCKSMDRFVRLAQAVTNPGNKVREYGIIPPQYPADQAMQEILLTTSPSGGLYWADEMSLQAVGSNGQSLGHEVSCQDCYRLDYPRWPQGTTKFNAKVEVVAAPDQPYINAVASHHTEL